MMQALEAVDQPDLTMQARTELTTAYLKNKNLKSPSTDEGLRKMIIRARKELQSSKKQG
jgi:hypothetical protein